ncbi:MAG: hypothetical protein EOP62_18525 [Sphingomonadales bacterium]|nr:MAG: hypothetical protein EOP62_18525 [Sphingomonadales bacterium]
MQRLIRRTYFPAMGLILLALTLTGFSDNLFTDVGQASNSDPKFIVHGLLCGAWIILFFVQTCLIARGNARLHRKLGIAGMVIAVGVALSTIWVFVAVWKGWAAMNMEAQANRLLLPSYALFVALGLRNRTRPDWHRRYLLAGTLFMLGPVLGRAFDPLVVPFLGGWTEPQIDAAFMPIFLGIWFALFASLFAYDAMVLRRIHPVTAGATLWFGAIWAIIWLI